MHQPKPVRVGVIGLGFMGATHVNAYQRAAGEGVPCVLTAVCDSDERRRSGHLSAAPGQLDTGAGQRAFDPAAVHCYATPEELFADPEVDLVSICTPTPSHVPLAEAALRAGKHVVVEKPVGLTPEPIERLAELARSANRLCMPAMCMRFWPHWSWLKQRIDAQTYGPLLGLSLTRLGAVPTWSQSFFLDGSKSGGALIDLHLHDADFLYHLFGRPAEVASAGFPGPSGRVDRVTTMYRYGQGSSAPKLVTAEGSWEAVGFAYRMRYVATFRDATADFDISRTAEPLLLCKDGSATPVTVSELSGYDLELRAAVRAVATGDHAGLPTLTEAAEVTRVLLAEEQSALSQRAVSL
jgi:predicted dehydrogenase